MIPRIALTMGDPAGVGPEVCLHALANPEMSQLCTPIVFGDADVLLKCAAQAGLAKPQLIIPAADWPAAFNSLSKPCVLDLGLMDIRSLVPGKVSAATGDASFGYIQRAIDAALAKQVDAVSTAPINKEAIHAAGHKFPGHTEMFASRANAERSCMMQFSPEITCTFVTVHCGYADVPSLLSIQRILDVIELTANALRKLHKREPSLVVCGLNPHAGENGLFGNREEENLIIPAINRAKQQGLQIEGPLPPDTAFLPWKRKTTDAFICMYHDQGHIPVKALAFDSAVNTTLGISIIRTSVDHGTACDIAWQGKARPESMYAALRLATRFATEL